MHERLIECLLAFNMGLINGGVADVNIVWGNMIIVVGTRHR